MHVSWPPHLRRHRSPLRYVLFKYDLAAALGSIAQRKSSFGPSGLDFDLRHFFQWAAVFSLILV